MIKPTPGRVVWFHSTVNDEPLAAIVTRVWNDRLVNLAVFNQDGTSFAATSVQLLQDDEKAAYAPYAEWMPFQKGQAQKQEGPPQMPVPSYTIFDFRFKAAELLMRGGGDLDLNQVDKLAQYFVSGTVSTPGAAFPQP